MATGKRLIDANELAHKFLLMPGHYRKAEIDLIDSAPTVDAVEVVRCKDCKRFGIYKCSGNGYCTHNNGIADPKPDYFCSYGERRVDNERKAD